MKINDIITEAENEEDSDKVEKHVRYIEQNCQPWLSQTNNGQLYVYRGFASMYGADDKVFFKKVRKDRLPRDSTETETKRYNRIIKKANKVANRHNSIFVTGNRMLASQYGGLYIVLPIDDFHYTWSQDLDDPLGDAYGPHNNKNYSWDDLQESLLGDDSTLQKAIKSGHEIMLSCDKIIAFKPSYYLQTILPKLGDQ